MEHVTFWILSLLKTLTLIAGLGFLLVAWRAYRKHRTRPLFVLILAVGLMTLATLAEGAAQLALGLDLDHAHIIEAIFMLIAFIVLLVSVLAPDRRRARLPTAPADGTVPGSEPEA